MLQNVKWEELKRLVESARAPRTKFSVWQDPSRYCVEITCSVRVRDVKTRKRDWIHLKKAYAMPITREPFLDEKFWGEQLRRLLKELMDHEIDEHLEIGGAKPFYPHKKEEANNGRTF